MTLKAGWFWEYRVSRGPHTRLLGTDLWACRVQAVRRFAWRGWEFCLTGPAFTLYRYTAGDALAAGRAWAGEKEEGE